MCNMSNEPIPLGNIGDEKPVERRDAAENRQLILQTAESLFAQHGVQNVNMADIAQVAHVGKGTLYRRFANKAELCLALMDSQMADFQNSMLDQMRLMAADGASALEQLDDFLDAMVYFTETHLPLLCEVQGNGLIENVGTQQKPYFWQHMTIHGLLQTAVQNGEVSDEIDIVYIADALLSTLHTRLFVFQREGRQFSLERISTGLRSLIPRK